MTETEAAELAMAIDTVGPKHGVAVVDGSGFHGGRGTIFAVELPNGERRLITCEDDWKSIADEALAMPQEALVQSSISLDL